MVGGRGIVRWGRSKVLAAEFIRMRNWCRTAQGHKMETILRIPELSGTHLVNIIKHKKFFLSSSTTSAIATGFLTTHEKKSSHTFSRACMRY